MTEVRFRTAEPKDKGFILKSWIRSYANSPWAGALSRERLMKAITGTIADLRQRGAEWVVAASASNPDVLYGFVCFERGWPWPLLHYVYVKDMYRNMGIGSQLVGQTACHLLNDTGGKMTPRLRYTFRAATKPRFLPEAIRSGKFSPQLARYPKREHKV
jgi:GNAT superfamily N-acetyltransferase